MSRATTTTRALEVELTPDELAKEAQALATAVEAVAKQEEALEEAKGLWSAKKKSMEGYLAHLKGDANALATVVDTGRMEREVACTWLYHLGSGYAFLTRDDTGELVTHRQLSDAERQTDLLEVLQEPTPEQFWAWVKELGLEVDPGLDAGPAAAFYATATMLDPREDEPEDDREERVVLRFSGPEKSPEQLTGVAILPADDGSFMGTRDNDALTYSSNDLVLQRAQASWTELRESGRSFRGGAGPGRRHRSPRGSLTCAPPAPLRGQRPARSRASTARSGSTTTPAPLSLTEAFRAANRRAGLPE